MCKLNHLNKESENFLGRRKNIFKGVNCATDYS